MAAAIEPTSNDEHSRDRTSPWPPIDAAVVAFLFDARDNFESELLRDWVERHKPAGVSPQQYSIVAISKSGANDSLAEVLDDGNCTWMQPLRIAWLPASADAGDRPLHDFFFGRLAATVPIGRRWLAKRQSDRLAYVAGDGATLPDLCDRHACSGALPGTRNELADFVAGQALIALERAERTIRGTRYKIPRILPSNVFANENFQRTLANAAQQRDRPVTEILAKAARYLKEMAAMQTPLHAGPDDVAVPHRDQKPS